MSIKVHDIPGSEYKLEVEYTNMIFRFLLGDQVAQVYHISGGPIGTCCIKDQHGTTTTFNMADHRALNYGLSLYGFDTAQHDRRLLSGEFLTKEIKIRGV